MIRFPIRDAHGEVAVVGCFALDITERKRAEAALKASEARLAAFMENAPVGMYLKDLAGHYLMANPEMGKLFGRPVETMIGRTAERRVPARGGGARIAQHNREVIETGRPLVTEEYLADRSDYAWSMIIRFPIRDEDGAVARSAASTSTSPAPSWPRPRSRPAPSVSVPSPRSTRRRW